MAMSQPAVIAMASCRRSGGFTLVELLVALVAGTVVFAAAGSVLLSQVRSTSNLEVAQRQRDNAVRLDTLPEAVTKRLLLGRAVLHDPAILALDDPFRALDPRGRQLCEKLIEAAVLVERTVVAALDDAIVPACFTHVALLDEGRIVARGPAHPATFAPGRTWTWRVTVPRDAVAARECLADRVPEAHLVDDHTVDCRIDPALSPPAGLVTALVRAGIGVESAGFHPFWSVQLVRNAS